MVRHLDFFLSERPGTTGNSRSKQGALLASYWSLGKEYSFTTASTVARQRSLPPALGLTDNFGKHPPQHPAFTTIHAAVYNHTILKF